MTVGEWCLRRAVSLSLAGFPPPDSVVRLFGTAGRPSRLPGGQGGSWRVGGVVFKRAFGLEEAIWVADTLTSLHCPDVRLPRPVQTTKGTWVADGWVAFEWLAGAHHPNRWEDVATAGRAFHSALKELDRPSFMDRRVDAWAMGDRHAWDEQRLARPGPVSELVSRLEAAKEPVSAPSQVVHGDLTGNVLFHGSLPPAIIDFCPYFRPVGFASAIIAVAAVAWEQAPTDLMWRLADKQMLLRAAIYRLVTAARQFADTGSAHPGHTGDADRLEWLRKEAAGLEPVVVSILAH